MRLSEDQVNSDEFKYRRNTVQGEIMRWADNRCDAELRADENRSGSETTVRVTQIVSLFLSALATAGATNNDQT